MISPPDDNTLLQAFQFGERAAERIIFDRFFRPLCLFSERITGDLHLSEDIVVEAFEKLLLRRTDFDLLPKLKAFLYQVVHNASVNHSISRRRRQAVHEKIYYLARQHGESDASYENDVLRAELIQEIYLEIENLPDKCRQIFKMLFIEELSTDDIATRLGINVQTVRTQKARALQSLRTSLIRRNRIQAILLLTVLTSAYVSR